MNICLLNNLFPPTNTGSSHYTHDLATNLIKNGHRIIVITSQIHDEKSLEYYKGIKIYKIKKFRLPKARIWLGFPDFFFTLLPQNFKTIKRILIENEIEVLHQCNNIFDLIFVSAYFSKKLNLPLICSLTTQIQHLNPFYNRILELFDRVIVKRFFSVHVTRFIALDAETSRYINERYNRYTNVTIIPFGIPSLINFSSIQRNYHKNNFVLVSLGHVSELKNRRELIECWPLVKNRFENARIVIIGGLFNKEIKRIVESNGLEQDIIFTGRLEHDSIPKHIKDADIGTFFFSKIPYHKGVGTANLELMASGLPVILDADDDFFGPDFTFKNGVHFVKLEKRDPEWLSKKIIELFENPEMRERIGKAGKDFVTTRLLWENIIPLVENVYAEAIQMNK